MRYFYKAKKNNGFLSLKTPLSSEELKNYVEITEAEFNQLTAKPQPTAAELARREKLNQIDSLKAQLASTDYQCLKYAEGWISEEDYAPIKASRQALRDQINELEAEL